MLQTYLISCPRDHSAPAFHQRARHHRPAAHCTSRRTHHQSRSDRGRRAIVTNETLTIVIIDPASATLPYVNVTGCLRVEGVVNVSIATPPETTQAITIAESPCLTFNGTGGRSAQ